MRIFAYLGRAKKGNRIVIKFCLGVWVPDVFTNANFGDDRFKGFFVGAGGQIFSLSIDLCCP